MFFFIVIFLLFLGFDRLDVQWPAAIEAHSFVYLPSAGDLCLGKMNVVAEYKLLGFC